MSLFTQTAKTTGVMKANGSSSSGVMSNLSTNRPQLGIYGSTVVDNDDVDTAFSGAILAYNNDRPVAKKTTSTINNMSNNALLSGASVPSLRRSVMKIEGTVTRQFTKSLREGSYNIVSNTFDSTCGDGNDSCPDVVSDDFGTDTAADVSVNNKGNLFYTLGHKQPITNSYND